MKPVFETYVPEERYFRQFAKAGNEVFSFSINLGHGFGPQLWLGPDRFDFSALDVLAQRVLKAKQGGWILPRIYLSPPDWWVANNPEEHQVLGDGSRTYRRGAGHRRDGRAFPSLASKKWRADTAGVLQPVIRHLLDSDYGERIFGFMVTGLMSEEWYHWSIHTGQLSDYSSHATSAFRSWLREKYESSESLRVAWGDAAVSLGLVDVPSEADRIRGRERTFRDPGTEMAVIDWYHFYNELIPETIDHFCAAAKRACQNRHVVGAFYAYMFEFGGDPEFGHNALGKLVRSEHLDFVMVTASYHNRDLGKGADYARSPLTTVRLHDKLWYHDNDTVSFLYDRIHSNAKSPAEVARYRKELGVTASAEESVWQYRRGAGFALGNGVFQSFFDLHGGYFDHPTLMGEVARLNRTFAASAEADLSSVAEILVISDEASCAYATFESGYLQQTLRQAQVPLAKIGAPHDSILVDDLDRVDMTRYRMVIFLNCFHLSSDQRKLVRKTVLNSGRTIIWCYANGIFEGNEKSLDAMSELCGFTMRWGKTSTPVRSRIAVNGEKVREHLAGIRDVEIGSPDVWARALTVAGGGGVIELGHLESTRLPALAMKAQSNWTSVYTVNPVLPSALWRSFAQKAGVHLYGQAGDTLYANKSFLCLNADGAGERTIRFPRPVSAADTSDGKRLLDNSEVLTKHFRDEETLLLQISSS
ncbi:MAG: beta-galactosidase [Verrucomicrobiota bacterium]